MTTRRDRFKRWGGPKRILCTIIGHRYEESLDYMSGEIDDYCSRCYAHPVPWLRIDRVKQIVARLVHSAREDMNWHG